MGGFFNLDGPFAKFGNIVADIILLGLLWTLASLPIVTVGAASTAVFYVTTKRVSGKEGSVLKDFWYSFRQNFLRSTTVFFLLAAMYAILLINILNIGIMENLSNIFLVLQFFVLIQVIFITIYVFPLMARFDMKLGQLLRTCFFMSNRHIFTTLQSVIIAVATFFIVDFFPFTIVMAMGFYAYISSYGIVKVLKKYRKDLDHADNIDAGLPPLMLDKKRYDTHTTNQNIPSDDDQKTLTLDTLKQINEDKDK